MTDIDRIHSSYDKLHGAGSHSRMTENEIRMLRLHPNHDASDMNRLLEIARVYDTSAKRHRIMHDLEVTKQKERLLGQLNCCAKIIEIIIGVSYSGSSLSGVRSKVFFYFYIFVLNGLEIFSSF